MSLLKGKTALVTGASRGIGRAAATALAGKGARVIVHYANSKAEADSIVSTIYDRGAAYECDLLFVPDRKTYLVDMDGRVLKTWDRGGEPAEMIDPSFLDGRKGVVGLQLADMSDSEMKGIASPRPSTTRCREGRTSAAPTQDPENGVDEEPVVVCRAAGSPGLPGSSGAICSH